MSSFDAPSPRQSRLASRSRCLSVENEVGAPEVAEQAATSSECFPEDVREGFWCHRLDDRRIATSRRAIDTPMISPRCRESRKHTRRRWAFGVAFSPTIRRRCTWQLAYYFFLCLRWTDGAVLSPVFSRFDSPSLFDRSLRSVDRSRWSRRAGRSLLFKIHAWKYGEGIELGTYSAGERGKGNHRAITTVRMKLNRGGDRD